MRSLSLPSTKKKEAYETFFDEVFLESAFGKTAFANPHPQSKYKLGGLSGLMLDAVPNEQLVLSAAVPKRPDAVVVLTFQAAGPGSTLAAAAVNLPEGAEGDKQRKAIETLLGAYAARFGGTFAADGKAAKKK